MLRTWMPLGLVAALWLVTGGQEAQAKVRVVATVPTLAALAAEVGGEHVEVVTLAGPNEDPHYVDARPDYVLRVNKADLLVLVGLELEVGWLPSLQTSGRNAAVNVGGRGYFDASAYITPLEVPTRRIERSEGDIHPGGNPHYLYDPGYAARVASALGERLAALDPANEEAYLARADALVATLERLRREQRARFAELSAERRAVVSYHASMVYLTQWLALREVMQIEPRPGISPDPGHVAKVRVAMKEQAVKVIIQEAYYPSATSKKLADLAGGTVVVIDGGPRFSQGESYVSYVQRVVDELFQAL